MVNVNGRWFPHRPSGCTPSGRVASIVSASWWSPARRAAAASRWVCRTCSARVSRSRAVWGLAMMPTAVGAALLRVAGVAEDLQGPGDQVECLVEGLHVAGGALMIIVLVTRGGFGVDEHPRLRGGLLGVGEGLGWVGGQDRGRDDRP